MSTAGEDSPSVNGANDKGAGGAGAPKNKHCPFCYEPFTSSSLGRHLDLYIKEKNPKAPDGIHDVDRIRQIRGAITRRQPRRSNKGVESSNQSAGGTPTASSHPRVTSPYRLTDGDKRKMWHLNRPTWEATGVMPDIPPTPTLTLGLDLDANPKPLHNDASRLKRAAEDRTRLRAVELALQELLDSVNAARSRANPANPFEFDFLSQTFPSLCLLLLPLQPSLHSVQTIENAKYCPISPPGHSHYELLQQILKSKLDEFAKRRASAAERRQSLRSTVSASTTNPEVLDSSQYTEHLAQAWQVWKGTAEAKKASQWHLEVFRALGNSQNVQKNLSDALAKAEAEQEHLRTQIKRLNECQQPKEFTYQIPSNWNITKETASALVSSQLDAPPDRETLIDKWVMVVRANSKFQRALPQLGLNDLNGNPNAMEMMDVRRDDGDDGESMDAAGEDDIDPHGRKTTFPRQNGIPQRVMPLDGMNYRVDKDQMLDPTLRTDGLMDVDTRDYSGSMNNLRATRGRPYDLQ